MNNNITEFENLIGKTIKSATQKKLKNCDDTGFLVLDFTDGTTTTIVASYGGYTGNSEDEYPTHIEISEDYNNSLE